MTSEIEDNNFVSQDRKTVLEKRLDALRSRRRIYFNLDKMPLIGVIIVVIAPILYYFSIVSSLIFKVILLYGFSFIVFPIISPQRKIDVEILDIENELDLIGISDDSIEKRTEKQFKLHQLELKKYYDQTLRQSSWIFYVGLICILAGFIIIGITLYLFSISFASIETSEQIILVSLGVVGTILADFVGVIYIKMYSETIKSLTEFHNRLVTTHFLHFGNFLIGKIDDQSLREKTLAEIASNLAKHKL